MFGFFKKKDNQDNGGRGYSADKGQSDARPQGPWAQAQAMMDQGRTAEALEQFVNG